MTVLFVIVLKGIWCGLAALGFGVLFNAPSRALFSIWVGGFMAGLVKFSALDPGIGLSIIAATFLAALFVGIVTIPLCKLREVPPILIAIPSIIPLVPGVFAYRAMMGLMKLAKTSGSENAGVISDTVYNGVMAFFVIAAIIFGLAIPLFAVRIRIPRRAT